MSLVVEVVLEEVLMLVAVDDMVLGKLNASCRVLHLTSGSTKLTYEPSSTSYLERWRGHDRNAEYTVGVFTY